VRKVPKRHLNRRPHRRLGHLLLISCRFMADGTLGPSGGRCSTSSTRLLIGIFAILLRLRIKDLVPDLQVFLASKAGEIPNRRRLARSHSQELGSCDVLSAVADAAEHRSPLGVVRVAGVAWSRGLPTPASDGGRARSRHGALPV